MSSTDQSPAGYSAPFETPLSAAIWDAKYRLRVDGVARDATIDHTWRRVARTLAAVEPSGCDRWERAFYRALAGFRFLPGGRIQAGADSPYEVTMLNCFVMGPIEDSVEGVCAALTEAGVTLEHGGGIGYDFSTLAPAGTISPASGSARPGPIAWMGLWEALSAAIETTGARRGAMMGNLRCDHPDIERFVASKREPGKLTHFNLSVLVTDALMHAVERDLQWPLRWPLADRSGDVVRELAARDLWAEIMRATYDHAEPGVVFIDRMRAADNLGYAETIAGTNPCGEIPLPHYGACDLGSINLTRFVREPFGTDASLDLEGIVEVAAVATRMLDNVYELTRFPLPRQREIALGARRIGLGLTGLADALIMLGLTYGSPQATALAARAMRTICEAAYRASIEIAREKGPFPLWNRDRHLAAPFVRALPADIQDGIAKHGIRNSHLTAIAPTGTISVLANNVSSGLEPVFAPRYERRVRQSGDTVATVPVEAYSARHFRARSGASSLPPAFVTAHAISPQAQLELQAALQAHVDNSISKTLNVPAEFPFDAFASLYTDAYRLGLKGCTTYRPNAVTGAILIAEPEEACCGRECRTAAATAA